MAETLGALGTEAAWIVHGNGLDELTVAGENHVVELRDGSVRSFTVTPEDAGLQRAPVEAIRGGDPALNANRPKQAIEDLRNPLSYAPDDPKFQLRPAQALAADNRIDPAEAYLFDLRNRQPGSRELNFELAQLEARKGNPDAARYFDNAIYGVWDKDAPERRLQNRLAPFPFLLSPANVCLFFTSFAAHRRAMFDTAWWSPT